MRISPRLLLIRLLTLVALGITAAILVDHIRPTPAFCSLNSGCEQVLYSSFGNVAGVPAPVFGLVAFGLLYAVSLSAKLRERFLGLFCVLAGVVGAGLIVFQVMYLKAVCTMCTAVDITAILITVAYVALGLLKRRRSSPEREGEAAAEPPAAASAETAPSPSGAGERDQSAPWFWVVLAVLTIVATLIAGMAMPLPRVPPEIRAMWVAGKINVIEVTDFECPHCKKIHPVLKKVLAEYGDRIHFERFVLPLPRHENAKGAARCYTCAEAQGKAEEMADELFAHDKLHARIWEHLAEHVGLNITEFTECMTSSQTEAKLDKEIAWLQKTDLRALPAICIQDQVLMGTQSPEKIHAAIRRAERSMKDDKVTR